MINSRKKLLLGLLERHGQEDFGINGHFPDKSMFRTVLRNTGLYRQGARSDSWNYVAPKAINGNPGLQAVWQELQSFLTEPREKPKDIAQFFNTLQRPPIGLRAGLIPIMFAAALKAFASAVSITKKGEYLNDILPTDIEDLCRNPSDYRLTVLELDEHKEKYLRGFHKHFSSVASYEIPHNDLIRQCYDALQAWKSQIPPAALTTRQLSKRAIQFRDGLVRITDPVRLLTKTIPEACGVGTEQPKKLMMRVRSCADELASIAKSYEKQASEAICDAIGLGRAVDDASISDVCSRWAAYFSEGFIEKLQDTSAKALLTRMHFDYPTDSALLDSLGSLLVGRGLSRWDDSTVIAFGREFHNLVRRVEDTSLSSEANSDAERVVELIYGRVRELYDRLRARVGDEEAKEILVDRIALGREGQLWHRSMK
jgi:hypothetical protein